MIIVSGRITVVPGHRDVYVAGSIPAMVEARRAPGCLDFVVAADPIEPDRVNVLRSGKATPTSKPSEAPSRPSR